MAGVITLTALFEAAGGASTGRFITDTMTISVLAERETVGGMEWVKIAIEDGSEPKTTGWIPALFVRDADPVPELEEEIDRSVFVENCLIACFNTGASVHFLTAWAELETGIRNVAQTPAGLLRIGPFQFTQKFWDENRTSQQHNMDFLASDIRNPAFQPEVAALASRRAIDAYMNSFDNEAPTVLQLFLALRLGVPTAAAIAKASGDASVLEVIRNSLGSDPDAAAKAAKLFQQQADLLAVGGTDQPKTAGAVVSDLEDRLDEALSKTRQLILDIDAALLPEAASTIGGAGQPTFPGSGHTIAIAVEELEALSKVAMSEVGHFSQYGEPVLKGGVKGVVDTIINRVAHRNYPDSIQAVVNQKKQFSAINPLGTWEKLPSASAAVAAIVTGHVRDRSKGGSSSVKGGTHFLNPFHADPGPLAEWGNHVVATAFAKFGDEARRDIHFHGLPPGGKAPDSYNVSHAGNIAGFTGDGEPLAAPAGNLRDAVVSSAIKEWEVWGKSTWNLLTGEKSRLNRDDDDKFAKYVRDTYCPIAMSQSDVPSLNAIQNDTFYWSGVAVSYMIRQARIGKESFKASTSHSTFIIEAIVAQEEQDTSKAFWGFRITDPQVTIEPGDIIACTRAEGLTLEQSLAYFDKRSRYDSHSDIVVDRRPGEIDVIGGNVRDSVTRKTIRLENGRIDDSLHNWFVVLKKR